MCGLIGVVGRYEGQRQLVEKGLELLGHRGPHGDGVRHCELRGVPVTVGGVRLEVVGGPDVVVPWHDEATDVTVAYNGEVYNWRQLRYQLSDGTPWATDCDTEVIARAWRAWGPGMLERFNGMFALAVVDHAGGCVFLARDRAGQKPLYYAFDRGALWFASEIKALPIERREADCPEMRVLEFDCRVLTPFDDVFRVEPAVSMLIDPLRPTVPVCDTWWQLPERPVFPEHMEPTNEAAAEELQTLIVDAIKIRSTADVPVSLLLSGGLDSAIIQAVVESEKLYCCDFEGVDNMEAARVASLGYSLERVTFGPVDLLEALPAIAWHLDTPATWSAVCLWFLARKIAADGGRVVLSGEGADELFGGYTRYRLLHHLDAMTFDQHIEPAYRPTRDMLIGRDDDVLARLLDRSGGSALEVAGRLVRQFAGWGPGLVARMSRLEFHTTMQVLLRMGDRMMAAHSLENRCPFLDYRIVEWSALCAPQLKITKHESKAVLRAVARRLGVPRSIVDERTKKGLFIPWQAWRAELVGGTATGQRGKWDRSGFARLMRDAWRQAFFGGTDGE